MTTDRARNLGDLRVLDGHNDLPFALRLWRDGRTDSFATGLPGLHTDLPRLRAGQVGAQLWSIWVPDEAPEPEMTVLALEQIDLVRRLVADHPDALVLTRTADEVEAARSEGRIASLLGLEGGAMLSSSPAVLRVLAALGLRYVTLTHNRTVAWAESAVDPAPTPGLTDLGRELVAEMNRLGVLADIAHVSEATMRDVLAVSVAPVISSHSCAKALCANPRNIPDDVLAGVAASGGTVMVTFVPTFLRDDFWAWERERDDWAETSLGPAPSHVPPPQSVAAREPDRAAAVSDARARYRRALDDWTSEHPPPRVTVADVADHVDHAREVAGVDHVGLGGDYDGNDHFPVALEDVSGYPALLAELADRGWSRADLEKLTWSNTVRVLRDAESVAAPPVR